MKLPDEVKKQIPRHELEQYDLSWVSVQTIVRDCAKVCDPRGQNSLSAEVRGALEYARLEILSRYGLE